MTRKEIMKEISTLSERINSLAKQLSDFSEILNAQRASDIDYIAMESGIDLDQDESPEQED